MGVMEDSKKREKLWSTERKSGMKSASNFNFPNQTP